MDWNGEIPNSHFVNCCNDLLKTVNKEPIPIILDGWISVEDRLPEEGQYVAMIDKFDEIPYSGQFKDGYFIDPKMSIWDDNMNHPDYWLPFTVKLPEK